MHVFTSLNIREMHSTELRSATVPSPSSIGRDRHAVHVPGFVLANQQQLDALKKYCSTVIVDLERSQNVEPAPVLRIAYPQKVPVEVNSGRRATRTRTAAS